MLLQLLVIMSKVWPDFAGEVHVINYGKIIVIIGGLCYCVRGIVNGVIDWDCKALILSFDDYYTIQLSINCIINIIFQIFVKMSRIESHRVALSRMESH